MFQVIYKKSAIKGLAKTPKKIRGKMDNELNIIASDPYKYQDDWKQLKGSDFWRLRIGRYRAIYHTQNKRIVLLVLKIGPRGDIYK